MHTMFLTSLVAFTLLTGLAWVGADIILPVIFAFLLFVIITAWNKQFARLQVAGRPLPARLQSVLAFVLFFVIVLLFSNALAREIGDFSSVYPELVQNVELKVAEVSALIGVDIDQYVMDNLPEVDVAGALTGLAGSLSSITSTLFVVFVYLLYIFSERKHFTAKLQAVSGRSFKQQQQLMSDIITSIEKYISIKTAISILTGVLSYIVMLGIGLEFAFVWAFIIFVMNFIPTIGSLIATALPVLFAFVAFPTMWQALALLIVIGAIQLYVGNALEPKYLGDQLNVSPLLLFFSLFFFNELWGIAGMFIAVPVTVIIMIVLSRIPATRSIGVWMSGDGTV